MRPVVVTTTAILASARQDVWPLLANTERMNRLLATSAVYRPVEPDAKTSARFVVQTKTGGFRMAYEEAPFEWTTAERFSVQRKMRSGPLEIYVFDMVLEPAAGGGTKVTVRIELLPRYWALRPVLRLRASRFLASVARLASEIDAHVRQGAPSPFLVPRAPADEDRLSHAERELGKRSLAPEVVRAVLELVRSGPDADMVRIRPFELAERAGLDRREMLRVFLHAVTAGAFELRWALVCPSCRTANDQVGNLASLGRESHCQLCDITYGVDLDRAVEATFRPHPSVRAVEDAIFCIGGPWRTPHVKVQANLAEGARRALVVPGEPGRYRLFARGGAVASLDVEQGAAADVSVELRAVAFSPSALRVAPGGAVTVVNASGGPLHVKLESLAYASLAATAHEVTTMSEFRRLFSKELLKPSTPLKVAHCAILFSDLTGSTALYTAAGDAAAFRLVDDHFDVLRAAIDEARGTVVKTMGDAVMAAFLDARQCVRAAVACLRAFDAFRRTHDHGDLTGLKLGLFAGPCYVVTANETLDYFGQTVNCASRVQHLAGSGEIVLEEEVYESLPDADKGALVVTERLEATVKGVDTPLRLVRTRLAPARPDPA